jgi:ribonucleases P/MRP protein subunit RPP40
MEKIIVNAMNDFLDEHHIIPKEQHGFVNGKSTITNLLACLNDWTKALDSKIPIDVIYLDFAKAFDRVPFKRLLFKLEHYGFRDKLLFWIENYLLNRNFQVKVGNSYSSVRQVTSGVPQGSVLGPLLFLIYASDLTLQIKNSKSLYADDTKIYANPVTDYHSLQNDLNSIGQWCSDWLLPLNVSKCVVLHIGKNNPGRQYTLHNQSLKNVTSHVDLGVTITADLSWSEHILSTCKRANSLIYLLKKTFVRISFQASIRLYKTYVRPILEYAGPVWCPVLIRDQNLLENVQRRATRITFNYYNRPSYPERLNMARLETFLQRRLRGDLIISFRILNFDYANLSYMYTLNSDYRLRGHKFKLKKEVFKTKHRQHFLTNRIFNVWNDSPAEIFNATSMNIFKNRIDSLLF